MKRLLFLAMLLAGCGLFTEEVSAQAVLGHHAITSGYHTGADGSVDLDGTIGQAFTGTASIPGQYLTQGFHQPGDNTPVPETSTATAWSPPRTSSMCSVSTGALRTVGITIPTKTAWSVHPTCCSSSGTTDRSANDLIRIHIPIEHFGLVQRKGGHSQRGLPSIILGHFAPMISGPTQEPTLRGEQTVDAALLTVVLALFVASAFGLTELPGGESSWSPKEWKGSTMEPRRSSCHCWH